MTVLTLQTLKSINIFKVGVHRSFTDLKKVPNHWLTYNLQAALGLSGDKEIKQIRLHAF